MTRSQYIQIHPSKTVGHLHRRFPQITWAAVYAALLVALCSVVTSGPCRYAWAAQAHIFCISKSTYALAIFTRTWSRFEYLIIWQKFVHRWYNRYPHKYHDIAWHSLLVCSGFPMIHLTNETDHILSWVLPVSCRIVLPAWNLISWFQQIAMRGVIALGLATVLHGDGPLILWSVCSLTRKCTAMLSHRCLTVRDVWKYSMFWQPAW